MEMMSYSRHFYHLLQRKLSKWLLTEIASCWRRFRTTWCRNSGQHDEFRYSQWRLANISVSVVHDIWLIGLMLDIQQIPTDATVSDDAYRTSSHDWLCIIHPGQWTSRQVRGSWLEVALVALWRQCGRDSAGIYVYRYVGILYFRYRQIARNLVSHFECRHLGPDSM